MEGACIRVHNVGILGCISVWDVLYTYSLEFSVQSLDDLYLIFLLNNLFTLNCMCFTMSQ